MKVTVDFESNKASLDIRGNAVPKKLEEVLANVYSAPVFETGLLPVEGTGLLSYRNGFGRSQFVYQIEPQKHLVKWGASEGTKNKKTYLLAEPYKIIISDFDNNNFLGSRHFYSPEPIMSFKQPLYAINLPNTNTIGYGGTSVGWICHYRHDNTTEYTLAQQIDYFLRRESGANEPYNDSNMFSTDGARFYQNRKAPAYIWDPEKWEAKTKEHGDDVSWTLEKDLFTPLKIDWSSTRSAESHNDKGQIYTLGDAVFKPYYAYYPYKFAQPFELPLNKYHELKEKGENPWANKDIQEAIKDLWKTGKIGTAQADVRGKPAKLSLEDLLTKVNSTAAKLEISKDVKNKFLSDGEVCVGCSVKKPHSEFPAGYNNLVVTKLNLTKEQVADRLLLAPQSLVKQFTREHFCSDCSEKKATVPVSLFNVRVAANLLEYSTHDKRYYLRDFTVKCKCSTPYMTGDAPKKLLWDHAFISKNAEHIMNNTLVIDNEMVKESLACVNCVEMKTDYKVASMSVFVKNEARESREIKYLVKCENLDDVSFLFGEEPNEKQVLHRTEYISPEKMLDKNGSLKIVYQTVVEYIPVEYLKKAGKKICPCNLPSKSEDICNSCLTEDNQYCSYKEILTKVTVTS